MPNTLRLIAALALVTITSLAASGSSAATLSINQSSSTATSTNSQLAILNLTGGRITVGCTTLTMRKTITQRGGAFSVAAVLSGCACNGVACTLTARASWTGQFLALLTGAQITGVLLAVTIPAGGLELATVGCTMSIEGTFGGLTAVTPTTPPALFTVASVTYANSGLNALPLRVTSATSGCATLYNVLTGNRASVTGTFTLSPTIIGTLV